MTHVGLPSLSVVVPVRDEEAWIARSVGAVLASARAARWPVEVVVVDDGSTDGTPEVLSRLAADAGVVVVTQPGSGRFAARRAGLLRATGERVLMVDSRVLTDEGALTFLAQQLREHPERRVWNGHVDVQTGGNPYAGFWSGLVAVGWRRYVADPRLVSFGAEDFDLYPKGAGFLSAPRELLLQAAEAFRSAYEDEALASDDTRMLRWVAERERFWISPDLRCTYHARSDLRGFLRHARFRGTTFVDGYLGAAGPLRRAAVLAAVAGTALLVTAVRRPRAGLLVGGAVPVGAALVVRRCGATRQDAAAVGLLLPPFVLAFGSGVLRGLRLAAVTALQRRRAGG